MKKILLLTMFTFLYLAGVSYADTFELYSSGYQNGSNVSVALPNGQADTFAAYFKMNFSGVDYMGYCVDYGAVNWNTYYYNYSMIAIPDNKPQYKAAAWLLETYGGNSQTWGVNVQLAIWEVIFDYAENTHLITPYDGDFYLLVPPASSTYGAGSANLATVQGYVNEALAPHPDFNASSYRLLVSPNTEDYYGFDQQDFIIKTPEPGMFALLGIGLLGLVLVTRRKARS